jgi:hypothetical protein
VLPEPPGALLELLEPIGGRCCPRCPEPICGCAGVLRKSVLLLPPICGPIARPPGTAIGVKLVGPREKAGPMLGA